MIAVTHCARNSSSAASAPAWRDGSEEAVTVGREGDRPVCADGEALGQEEEGIRNQQ